MKTISPADPNILYSPYNWHLTDTAKTVNAGAYFKLAFSGVPGSLTANFDTANMAIPASRIGIRVDGGPWQDTDVAPTVPLVLPADNTWDIHTVEVVVISTTETAPRWMAPQNTAVIFTGITAGADIETKALRPRGLYLLAAGDSITEGVRTLNRSAAADTDRNDARSAWGYLMGDLLGAEVGVVGFGAVGISKAGNGGVPKFRDSAPYLFSGVPRSLATPREPDAILANIGSNDTAQTDAAVAADTAALMNYWLDGTTRAPVFVFNWLQRKAAAIQAGIAASKAPHRITYVDTADWWKPAESSDALHPYGYSNVIDLAPRLAAVVRPALSAAPASKPVVFYRHPSGTPVPISTQAF